MANIVGSFARGTTGQMTVSSLPFTPTWIRFWVCAYLGNSSDPFLSMGSVDQDGNQICLTQYNDGTNRTTQNHNDRCIEVWKHASGSWSTPLKAEFVEFVTNGFKLDFEYANANYDILYEAGDS